MIIFPAIDLRGGNCVRLVQGRKEEMTVYSSDPARMARFFADQGASWLHVVDLDGAFEGLPKNIECLKAITREVDIPVQFGGGLRTLDAVESALEAGASRVVIGTRALEDPDFMLFLLNELGPAKVALGIDARDGMVATSGWQETSKTDAVSLSQTMARMGAEVAVYTDISRDGLLQGPNFEETEKMVRESGMRIVAAGGVTTLEDIRRLAALGVEGAIIGKALYEGKIDLAEVLAAVGG
jgi:phosphoribosylformimino-5-aminoimidazole carboxamide ribotide isomerase